MKTRLAVVIFRCSAGVLPAFLKATGTAALLLIVLFGCARIQQRKIQLPAYKDFISVRQDSLPSGVLEIYGHSAATLSGKTVRSSFNLLLDPGKNAYIEILNPASQMTHSCSLNGGEVSLLWAQDQNYIEEKATAQNLNAITGLPVMPDDLLYLIAGMGLNFPQWQVKEPRKDGWDLTRPPFQAQLQMREQVSKISISSPGSPNLIVKYDEYNQTENRSLPAQIRFEIPARKISLDLKIDKYVPRDEPASSDLFALKLPGNAHRLALKEIYRGKPLLLQQ